MIGIINVYKEKGMTSFDVIAKLRKMLHIKKIGHTGTLDPNATGVLPICIGNATKLVDYIMNEDKEYQVIMKLGIKTDSGDITGNIIEKKEISLLDDEQINNVMSSFIGNQLQIPPMYSAIKVNGKKLYDLARKGITVEREKRSIYIYAIENVEYNNMDNTISCLVKCSKGTYIRTLCEDICEKLGTVGTVLELERTKTGVFQKDSSYTIEQIEKNINEGTFDSILYNIEDLFANYEKIVIDKTKLHHFLNGVKLTHNNSNGIYTVYCDNKFIGIGQVNDSLLKRKFIL